MVGRPACTDLESRKTKRELKKKCNKTAKTTIATRKYIEIERRVIHSNVTTIDTFKSSVGVNEYKQNTKKKKFEIENRFEK